MKVLYTLPLEEEQKKRLEELGYTVFTAKDSGPFSEEALSSDVLVTFNAFMHLDIANMPHLKLIQVGTTGLNQIPLSAVDRGIAVTNNPYGFSLPIGEWIVTKVLESYKNTRQVYQQQRDHVWKMDTTIDEINGKKALFIGTGGIAREGAKRLAPFGVEITGVNRSGKPNEHFPTVISMAELPEKINEFDIVAVVLPGTMETYKLVNRELIENMKDGSVFINISRGSVVEQDALQELAGKFRALHLDVFEEEPLPENHPFWDMENVYVSSHTSWASSRVNERRFENNFENLKAFIKGEKLPSQVDLLRGY